MTYEPPQWAARTACTFAGAGPLSVAAIAILLKDRTSRHLAAGLLPRELDPRDAARLLPLAPPRGLKRADFVAAVVVSAARHLASSGEYDRPADRRDDDPRLRALAELAVGSLAGCAKIEEVAMWTVSRISWRGCFCHETRRDRRAILCAGMEFLEVLEGSPLIDSRKLEFGRDRAMHVAYNAMVGDDNSISACVPIVAREDLRESDRPQPDCFFYWRGHYYRRGSDEEDLMGFDGTECPLVRRSGREFARRRSRTSARNFAAFARWRAAVLAAAAAGPAREPVRLALYAGITDGYMLKYARAERSP